MDLQRIAGIGLLVLGGILLFVGLNASNSVVDQVSNTFTGKFTQNTTAYIIGGILSAIIGLFLSFVGVRRKSA